MNVLSAQQSRRMLLASNSIKLLFPFITSRGCLLPSYTNVLELEFGMLVDVEATRF